MTDTDNDVTVDEKEAQSEEEIRVCLFSIAEETYAVPVELLTEIIIPQKIFPVPTTPPHVLGVINLRGNIVPIVDIRQALSLAPHAGSIQQIAILKQGVNVIGIVVDAVYEVISAPLSSILAIPVDYAAGGKSRGRFFKGIIQREAGLAALLNVDRILEEIKLA